MAANTVDLRSDVWELNFTRSIVKISVVKLREIDVIPGHGKTMY